MGKFDIIEFLSENYKTTGFMNPRPPFEWMRGHKAIHHNQSIKSSPIWGIRRFLSSMDPNNLPKLRANPIIVNNFSSFIFVSYIVV
jgi:hypothetical protein